MKRFSFVLLAIVTAGMVALPGPTPGQAEGQSAPYVTEMPHGYRDFRWISSTHEAGKLNSLGALLANDVGFNAFRKGNFRSLTARSLPLCIISTFPRMRTTRSLARSNLSSPALPRTFSSWSRTRPSTPQPAAGGLGISAQTANPPMLRL